MVARKMDKAEALLRRVAGRYQAVVTELDRLETEKACLGAELIQRIPDGETLYGVQHSAVEKLVAEEVKLREHGFWREVAVEKADGQKLRALLKLHPEARELGCIRVDIGHRLVVRG